MATTINTYTILAGIAFKVAFAAADAPESLSGVTHIEWIRDLLSDYTLAVLARSVYLGVFVSSLIPIATSRIRNPSTQRNGGKLTTNESYISS